MKRISKKPTKRQRAAFSRAERRELKKMIRGIMRGIFSGAAVLSLAVLLTGCPCSGKRLNSNSMQTVEIPRPGGGFR